MRSRREFQRADVSPFSGQEAAWSSVSGYVSDYVVEEAATGAKIRVVDTIVDHGFHLGGSFHDREADLSRTETEETVALLLSKSLQRHLEGAPDVWLMPHGQLDRSRSRTLNPDRKWFATSVFELFEQVQTLSEEAVAVQTLKTFSLFRSLLPTQRIGVRVEGGRVVLDQPRSGATLPPGLVYGSLAPAKVVGMFQKLFDAELIAAIDASAGRQEITITQEGLRVVDLDAPQDLELKGYIREVEESRQHPVPDLTLVTCDTHLARILADRWREADVCHRAGSFFAASVLIGSILEGCLLARVRLALAASHDFVEKPDRKSAMDANEWGLANLLAVCANEGWIRQERHRLGHVLRESRNLVHPANIEEAGDEVDERTVRTYWEILQGTVEDLVRSQV